MSPSRTLSASEVVRAIEARLAVAAFIRKKVQELERIAAQAEQDAQHVAFAALGEMSGRMTLAMAQQMLPTDLASVDHDVLAAYATEMPELLGFAGTGANGSRPPQPSTPNPTPTPTEKSPVPGSTARIETPAPAPQAPPPAPTPAPVALAPSAMASADDEGDATRSAYYGVEFPARRKSDADEVVAAARKAAATGAKGNPYQGNRGKNAWRPKLFDAACEAERKSSPGPAAPQAPAETKSVEASAPVAPETEETVVIGAVHQQPVEVPDDEPALEAADDHQHHDDVDDDDAADAEMVPVAPAPAPVPAAPPPSSPAPTPEPAPAPPSAARPGFGVPVPAPKGLKLPGAPVRRPSAPPGVPPRPSGPPGKPSFLKNK